MSTFAVTGANGFIASHLITKLLSCGHNVRGTVRDTTDASKMGTLNNLNAKYPGQLKIFEVSNLKDPASMIEAFSGVDGVFHLAAVHPEYGFKDVPEGREEVISTAVEGSLGVMKACKEATVKRVVLTSSLAAVECGNDEGTLTESTWADASVYDNTENQRGNGQWSTHYAYVKSKVEQEKAVTAYCTENNIDLRVVVPGNLCIGPVASTHINGTMKRIADIMQGTNTLKGCADLGIVHVQDVVETEVKCMTTDSASGRYLVTSDMVKIEDMFTTIKELYPQYRIAELNNQDISSGIAGKARSVETRVTKELDVNLTPFSSCLKDAVDSMIEKKIIVIPAVC